jgi:hypothetical protein
VIQPFGSSNEMPYFLILTTCASPASRVGVPRGLSVDVFDGVGVAVVVEAPEGVVLALGESFPQPPRPTVTATARARARARARGRREARDGGVMAGV